MPIKLGLDRRQLKLKCLGIARPNLCENNWQQIFLRPLNFLKAEFSDLELPAKSGRGFETLNTGGSMLADFSSAVEALECAAEFQVTPAETHLR
jgi:hypothetical protein